MSKADAEEVRKHLQNAERAAVPLKDNDLSKRIREATTHIEKKLDPTQGG